MKIRGKLNNVKNKVRKWDGSFVREVGLSITAKTRLFKAILMPSLH